MALSCSVYKSNRLFSRFVSPIANIIKNVHSSNSQKTEIDVLDSFTTQLLQKKSYKWENMRIRRKVNEGKLTVLNNTLNNAKKEELSLNILSLDIEQLNELITENLDSLNAQNIIFITNQCIEHKICPSAVNLLQLLSFFAQNGDKDTITRLQIHVEKLDPVLYATNAKFVHYVAEATWIRGNISESLKLFEDVYKDYLFLRRKLKLMIKFLITNVISERSEATLVSLINFSENIAENYDDYFPLVCVWQACFLSEWYTDQCRATEILDKHEKLCWHIANRIQFVVNSALKSHQTEVVHRLFELLLKYNMKSHYTFVLHSLFNYRYWQNDLRSCAEIIQWSLNIDVPLSTLQHEQFISLLLNHDIKNSNKVSKKPKTPEDFQLKF